MFKAQVLDLPQPIQKMIKTHHLKDMATSKTLKVHITDGRAAMRARQATVALVEDSGIDIRVGENTAHQGQVP